MTQTTVCQSNILCFYFLKSRQSSINFKINQLENIYIRQSVGESKAYRNR